MKISKWIGIAVVILLVIGAISGAYKAIWLSSHGGEIISDDVRTSFIEGSNETCIEGQSNNPASAGVSHEIIVAYCSCTSNKIADQMTNVEIASISKGGSISPDTQTKIDAAIKVCLENAQETNN